MKKRAVIIFLIAIIGILGYLQFGRDMDCDNSWSFSNSNQYYEESINVFLNKLVVTDSNEEIAEEIIQKVIVNDFKRIKFSFDVQGYPNTLNVSVYKNERDCIEGKKLFGFTYGQAGDKEIGKYDIRESEHMELKIWK